MSAEDTSHLVGEFVWVIGRRGIVKQPLQQRVAKPRTPSTWPASCLESGRSAEYRTYENTSPRIEKRTVRMLTIFHLRLIMPAISCVLCGGGHFGRDCPRNRFRSCCGSYRAYPHRHYYIWQGDSGHLPLWETPLLINSCLLQLQFYCRGR